MTNTQLPSQGTVPGRSQLRRHVYHWLAGPTPHSTLASRIIDRALLLLILVNSVLSAMETVDSLTILHGHYFHWFDRVSVVIFSIEYVLRVWTAVEDPRFAQPLRGRLRFMVTPLALVDLLSVLPFYFTFFFSMDLRSIRVLRLLRIMKLGRHSDAMSVMAATFRRESQSIGAVMFVFLVLMVVELSLIYLVEHPEQPTVFRDVPTAMWWAVVTMTTVGYGDMVPITPLGRLIGGITAIAGVGMIALPAGILASGFNEQMRLRREEYRDDVEKALQKGPISAKARRHLEEARLELGLSPEDAALVLAETDDSHAEFCPHCGRSLSSSRPKEDG